MVSLLFESFVNTCTQLGPTLLQSIKFLFSLQQGLDYILVGKVGLESLADELPNGQAGEEEVEDSSDEEESEEEEEDEDSEEQDEEEEACDGSDSKQNTES